MPRAPVVEIWRSEVKPYSPRPPSPTSGLITPTSTPTKRGSKSKSKSKSDFKIKVETEFESPKSPKSPVPSGRGQPWTPAEKLKLYAIVIKQGANMKHFEGQIEGRTAHQCYMAWSYVILILQCFYAGRMTDREVIVHEDMHQITSSRRPFDFLYLQTRSPLCKWVTKIAETTQSAKFARP